MTKQEFLSASLPYGLNMYYNDGSEYLVETLDGIYRGVPMIGCAEADGYVPVIRNISDLTKECIQADYNDGKPFIPMDVLCQMWIKYGKEKQGVNSTEAQFKRWFYTIELQAFPFYLFQQFIKWHFDLITEDCEKVYVTDEFNPYK